MMYTAEMAQAFRSLSHYCPKGFALQVVDNDNFITLKADEADFFKLDDFNKRRAVEYMALAKKALEQNGAIVLLVRSGGADVI
jgi:membrane protease subunit (stomatin/prohibitin family)